MDERIKKSDCCCTTIAGACFDDSACPRKNSKAFRELCNGEVPDSSSTPNYFDEDYTIDDETDYNNPNYDNPETSTDMNDYDGSGGLDVTTEKDGDITEMTTDESEYVPDNNCPMDMPNFCRLGTCEKDYNGIPICNCPAGLIFDIDTNDCEIAKGKCAENPHLCRHGFCHSDDSDQGYKCTCEKSGWRVSMPNRDACLDINECEDSPSICSNGECVNTPGSYRCDCQDGFERIQSGECADIDECNTGIADCGAGICLNESPGFTCLCDQGYELSEDKKTCVDINECANDQNLCKNGDCINQPGSYYCSCDAGFTRKTERERGDDGNFKLVSLCVDIDECSESNPCGENRCVNSAGSYSCICKPFYTNDGGDSGSCIRKYEKRNF